MSRKPWPLIYAACVALFLLLSACGLTTDVTPGPGTPQAAGATPLPTLAAVPGTGPAPRTVPTLAPLPSTATPGVIVQPDLAAVAEAAQPPPTVCTNTPIPLTPVPSAQPPYPGQPTPGPTWQPGPTSWVTVLPTSGGATGFTTVKVALIVPGGGNIGCGDGFILIDQQVPPTQAVLTAAIKRLLQLRHQTYGQMYNALYQSDLEVQSVAVKDGIAFIHLTGQLKLGGECDDPRVAAQLEATARQFSTVRVAQITVNGKPLKDVLSEK